MKYILDTASQNEIEKYLHIIDGVTSNPILLKKEDQTPDDFLEYMQQYNIKRFIQVFDFSAFERIYKNFNSNNYELIFKVALKYPEGINLIQQIKSAYPKAKIAATMMYDIVQLNNAIEFGCDYSMVYIAKNENENFLEEAVKLKNNINSDIKLVAASFRTKNDVKRAIKSGIEYSTVPPAVLEKSLINGQVELEYSNLI
ncbi:MAG: hypothetical protein ACOCP4_02265 [Candidatus Woesearchaeota archaeon]